MKLQIDEDADALYLRLDEESVVESEEVEPGVILDFDKEGRVVGFELLGLSARRGGRKLGSVTFETP
mgnify:CR=1 FL=1